MTATIKVRTEYNDGDFYMEPFEGFYAQHPDRYSFEEIPIEDWYKYQDFLVQHRKWQIFMRELDSKIYAKEHPDATDE